MADERTRLMAWQPGAPGYTFDDLLVAIGLQCGEKKFALRDVLKWLGTPDRAVGDSRGGHLVYYFHGANETAAMFDVTSGKVTAFSTVAKFINNAQRADPATGTNTCFNVLDEMKPFDGAAFI